MDGALFKAAREGDTVAVKGLLDRGADKHARNVALVLAAECGHTTTARLLLDRGADIHVDNDYAFRSAIKKNHKETVQLLLDRGADIHVSNEIGLLWAAGNGCTEMVQLLLDRGANVHARDNSALCFAAECGYTKIVRLLLDRGADIQDAIRMTVANGHTEMMQMLLYNDAAPDAMQIALRRCGVAIQRGHIQIVRLLLEHGADPVLFCKPEWFSYVEAPVANQIKIALLEFGIDVRYLKNHTSAQRSAAISYEGSL
jgi:ankyrin repeat protein